MGKVICAMAALAMGVTANAAITTSIDGGTSYIHLGRLSAKECKGFVDSPASAGLLLAFDGHARAKGEDVCHDGVRLDILTRDPVIRTTDSEITTWPLAKDRCKETVTGLLKAHQLIVVNDEPVANTPQAQAACSKSSNVVSVPR